jgi:hypothetical protein
VEKFIIFVKVSEGGQERALTISAPPLLSSDFMKNSELEAIGNNIRLHLKPKMPLISAEEPLPPREGMREYFALAKIRRQKNHCAII